MGAIRMCGAVLYRDGRVLLGKRSRHRTFYPGVWDLPGGHCYAGEAPDRALARELQEEIGVRPVTMVLLATADLPGTGAETAEYSVYLVTEWVGEPTNLLREEHEALGWFLVDEASELALASPRYPELFRKAERTAQR